MIKSLWYTGGDFTVLSPVGTPPPPAADFFSRDNKLNVEMIDIDDDIKAIYPVAIIFLCL